MVTRFGLTIEDGAATGGVLRMGVVAVVGGGFGAVAAVGGVLGLVLATGGIFRLTLSSSLGSLRGPNASLFFWM